MTRDGRGVKHIDRTGRLLCWASSWRGVSVLCTLLTSTFAATVFSRVPEVRERLLFGLVVVAGLVAFMEGRTPRPKSEEPMASPSPRLPQQILGDWVQVFPARGALERFTFRSDSTFAMHGRGDGSFWTERGRAFHPRRWYIDTRHVLGRLCVAELPPSPTRLCGPVTLRGDTLRLHNEEWSVLLRVREGVPLPTKAWKSPGATGRTMADSANSNSFGPPRPVIIRP